MSLEILPARISDLPRSKGRSLTWYERWWKGHRRRETPKAPPAVQPERDCQDLRPVRLVWILAFLQHMLGISATSLLVSRAANSREVDDPVQLFFLLPPGGLLLSITNAILQAQNQTLAADDVPN